MSDDLAKLVKPLDAEPTDEQVAAHRDWFAAEYPRTFADMERDDMSARVIFAHSEVAWCNGLTARKGGA
jgi:hypothetical protein